MATNNKEYPHHTTIYASAVIPAPLEEVWNRAGTFADLSWGGVPETRWLEEGYQQKDNVVGKHREINLGGKKIVELLTAYSTREHYYTYEIVNIDEGIFPGKFINYKARLSFKSVSEINATFAEWSATFDGQEDTAIAVQQAIQNGVFLGGLGKLKQALTPTQSA